jgi:hypothetical protein
MSLSKNVTATIESINGIKAARMLAKINPRQAGRHNQSAIDSYSKQMTAGLWREDVLQTIAVDRNGDLMNGYHRLNALVKANEGRDTKDQIKLQYLVVRGVDPASFGDWDAGIPRSLSYRSGVSQDRTALLNSIINVSLYPYRASKITVEQLMLTDDLMKEPVDYFLANTTHTKRARVTTANVRAGVIFNLILFPKNRVEICEAYNNLVKRDFKAAPQSITKLEDRMTREHHSHTEQVVLAFNAFNPKKFDNKMILVKDYRGVIDDIKARLLTDLAEAIS